MFRYIVNDNCKHSPSEWILLKSSDDFISFRNMIKVFLEGITEDFNEKFWLKIGNSIWMNRIIITCPMYSRKEIERWGNWGKH